MRTDDGYPTCVHLRELYLEKWEKQKERKLGIGKGSTIISGITSSITLFDQVPSGACPRVLVIETGNEFDLESTSKPFCSGAFPSRARNLVTVGAFRVIRWQNK